MEFDNTEIENTVRQLRNENQIVSKELLGLVGNTKDGLQVWFPNTYQRGYRDALTPVNERPRMLWQFLGIVGYFSDGNFNYLPTYNQAFQHAQELKTNIIAAQTLRLTQKTKDHEETIKELKKRIEELERKKSKD